MSKKKLKKQNKGLLRKNKKLYEKVERLERLLNKAYDARHAIVVSAGDFDGDIPNPVHLDEGCHFNCDDACKEKCVACLDGNRSAGPLVPLYPYSTKRTEENPDELSCSELILKYGRDILKEIGRAAWTNNKKFNNVDDYDYIDLQLPGDSVLSRITQYCDPLDFIFSEAQTNLNSSLYVMLESFVTLQSAQGIAVAEHPIEISIPLDNCKCPSHIIRVIRDSVKYVMNEFAENNKTILSADSGDIEWWVADIADYVLGMFIVSCMLSRHDNDEEFMSQFQDFPSDFSSALLRDEINIPHEISNVAIMFRTMMFENGHKTACEANEFIIPIIDSKAILYKEYKDSYKTHSDGSSD